MRLSKNEGIVSEAITAIRTGQVEELRRILEKEPALAKAVIVDAEGNGRTLLHVAADWPGHWPRVAETIAVLIAAGVDVNARMEFADGKATETALHGAASSDDVDAIDALLDGGADIEASGAVFTGGAPMSDAVIFAQWNAARRLLSRGARTTFWQAAALGLLDRVRELFAVEQPSTEELTKSLWHACRGGALSTAMFLVEHGADVNWLGWDHIRPLDGARQSGNGELVEWLLSKGAVGREDLR